MCGCLSERNGMDGFWQVLCSVMHVTPSSIASQSAHTGTLLSSHPSGDCFSLRSTASVSYHFSYHNLPTR
ncbi:hypothetical protein QQG55_24465 [Brugia pahangi]